MELWSAERVWARIDFFARAQPGGVVAVDGDGTLWSGDVGDDLFHAFLKRGKVAPPAFEAMLREAREHALSDAGNGSDIARRIYDAYLDGNFPEERMCEVMTWCFAGWTSSEVQAFARDVVQNGGLVSRLQGEVLRLLERVRAADIDTVIVSASPVHVVIEAALHVGLGEGSVVAAVPRFEGEVMVADVERPIPYADGKVLRLRQHVGPGRTLYAALGDNAFDVALLASALVPVAVRPKPRLRERSDEVDGLVELER